jgi:hypothetical protein
MRHHPRTAAVSAAKMQLRTLTTRDRAKQYVVKDQELPTFEATASV